MLVDGVLTILWSIAEPLINKMPEIAINYDGIASSTVFQFLQAGAYMLPIGTVNSILSIVVGLWIVRVVIAFLHSLWAALPVV